MPRRTPGHRGTTMHAAAPSAAPATPPPPRTPIPPPPPHASPPPPPPPPRFHARPTSPSSSSSGLGVPSDSASTALTFPSPRSPASSAADTTKRTSAAATAAADIQHDLDALVASQDLPATDPFSRSPVVAADPAMISHPYATFSPAPRRTDTNDHDDDGGRGATPTSHAHLEPSPVAPLPSDYARYRRSPFFSGPVPPPAPNFLATAHSLDPGTPPPLDVAPTEASASSPSPSRGANARQPASPTAPSRRRFGLFSSAARAGSSSAVGESRPKSAGSSLPRRRDATQDAATRLGQTSGGRAATAGHLVSGLRRLIAPGGGGGGANINTGGGGGPTDTAMHASTSDSAWSLRGPPPVEADGFEVGLHGPDPPSGTAKYNALPAKAAELLGLPPELALGGAPSNRRKSTAAPEMAHAARARRSQAARDAAMGGRAGADGTYDDASVASLSLGSPRAAAARRRSGDGAWPEGAYRSDRLEANGGHPDEVVGVGAGTSTHRRAAASRRPSPLVGAERWHAMATSHSAQGLRHGAESPRIDGVEELAPDSGVGLPFPDVRRAPPPRPPRADGRRGSLRPSSAHSAMGALEGVAAGGDDQRFGQCVDGPGDNDALAHKAFHAAHSARWSAALANMPPPPPAPPPPPHRRSRRDSARSTLSARMSGIFGARDAAEGHGGAAAARQEGAARVHRRSISNAEALQSRRRSSFAFVRDAFAGASTAADAVASPPPVPVPVPTLSSESSESTNLAGRSVDQLVPAPRVRSKTAAPAVGSAVAAGDRRSVTGSPPTARWSGVFNLPKKMGMSGAASRPVSVASSNAAAALSDDDFILGSSSINYRPAQPRPALDPYARRLSAAGSGTGHAAIAAEYGPAITQRFDGTNTRQAQSAARAQVPSQGSSHHPQRVRSDSNPLAPPSPGPSFSASAASRPFFPISTRPRDDARAATAAAKTEAAMLTRDARSSRPSSAQSDLLPRTHAKRPTFGLDLQPDAAAAFDSIPSPSPSLKDLSIAGFSGVRRSASSVSLGRDFADDDEFAAAAAARLVAERSRAAAQLESGPPAPERLGIRRSPPRPPRPSSLANDGQGRRTRASYERGGRSIVPGDATPPSHDADTSPSSAHIEMLATLSPLGFAAGRPLPADAPQSPETRLATADDDEMLLLLLRSSSSPSDPAEARDPDAVAYAYADGTSKSGTSSAPGGALAISLRGESASNGSPAGDVETLASSSATGSSPRVALVHSGGSGGGHGHHRRMASAPVVPVRDALGLGTSIEAHQQAPRDAWAWGPTTRAAPRGGALASPSVSPRLAALPHGFGVRGLAAGSGATPSSVPASPRPDRMYAFV